ncbi:MAG: DUF6106 family protein [Defluviitaleaceae bacterium]|nr:DUF6106 family protein [Defluviitaleaceae bacterium]
MVRGDVFKEQIVKRQSTPLTTLKKVGLVIAALFIGMIGMAIGQAFGPFILAAVVFAAWFGMSFLNVEYEYTFTAGELDIDAIYNRSRRKRIFSARVNDFEIMAHVEDNRHTGAFHGAQVTKNYSSGVVGSNTYAFMLNHQNKRTKIIIEPNDIMLKALASVLTRRRLHIKL